MLLLVVVLSTSLEAKLLLVPEYTLPLSSYTGRGNKPTNRFTMLFIYQLGHLNEDYRESDSYSITIIPHTFSM